MKTIAVYNNKGGIGKTTFSVHVALYAAKHHIRTLAVGSTGKATCVCGSPAGTVRCRMGSPTATAITCTSSTADGAAGADRQLRPRDRGLPARDRDRRFGDRRPLAGAPRRSPGDGEPRQYLSEPAPDPGGDHAGAQPLRPRRQARGRRPP
ncbi:MAG: AAA family ATPase [Nannocystis sp.]|nr:AAA family ATPase [Nannocystis sp.]